MEDGYEYEYKKFFSGITGHEPFPYQERLGCGPWPDLLEIPTGLGKTAAVIVAWLHRRLTREPETPARLVYCLPMRVLAEQTRENAATWCDRAAPLFRAAGEDLPATYLLMGGESDPGWVESPERPAIVIGTQDMLLSRALMRGYGMSRYQWPIHFALLHNDAFWVFDEIQLMGPGLATSAQLEAFRRSSDLARPCRSLWVSATLNPDWLATRDLRDDLPSFRRLGLEAAETEIPAVARRRGASKRLHRAETVLTKDNAKQRAREYADSLAREIMARHVRGATTLVILNTVERAQALLDSMERAGCGADVLLVHSRFRPRERSLLNRALVAEAPPEGPGRIIIATQAVEAGVDMTSRVLFTELAPWSSLVQRFGRCNRYGETGNGEGAEVFWIDIDQEAGLASPYDPESLDAARARLVPLAGVSPAELPPVDEPAPLHLLLRRRDFLDLFNTDPDLAGFDVDVAPYIRDAEESDLQVFWRDLDGAPGPEIRPHRDELCRASLRQAEALRKRIGRQGMQLYSWDGLDGEWRPLRGRLRPGLVLLLDCRAGGYSARYGLRPESRAAVEPLALQDSGPEEGYGADWRCRQDRPVPLASHLADAVARGELLCLALGMTAEEHDAVRTAAAWHDLGKAHPVFQATMHGCPVEAAPDRQPLLAKSPCRGGHARRYFRHEVASMLTWLAHADPGPMTDLVAFLIVAHHGKVRLSLRAMPGESPPTGDLGPRFARGIWEGEEIPAVDLPGGGRTRATRLRLDLMELGRGEMGSSWSERTRSLLERHGPFRLAWLETLVRLADWRASAAEQEEEQ